MVSRAVQRHSPGQRVGTVLEMVGLSDVAKNAPVNFLRHGTAVWASLLPCSVIQKCFSSTSPSMVSTPKGFFGFAIS